MLFQVHCLRIAHLADKSFFFLIFKLKAKVYRRVVLFVFFFNSIIMTKNLIFFSLTCLFLGNPILFTEF